MGPYLFNIIPMMCLTIQYYVCHALPKTPKQCYCMFSIIMIISFELPIEVAEPELHDPPVNLNTSGCLRSSQTERAGASICWWIEMGK